MSKKVILPGKGKLGIDHSMNIEDVPKKTSKQTYRKYMMPSSFLSLKKKLTSINDQKFSLLNATRKYFGSKIARLSNSSLQTQANSVRNYFRYFRDVKFEETRCWGDGSVSPIMATIKSLGNIGILTQPIQINRATVRSILSTCPCKVLIISDKHHNVKWWLSMPIHMKSKIKHFEIAFSRRKHLELLDDTHLFKDFGTIESCAIHITDDDYNRRSRQQPSSFPVSFIVALCQIKTLKSLELNLSEISISREMLTTLLNEISKNEPLRWHLRVLLEHKRYDNNYPIEIGEVKTVLNKLDFLSLKARCPTIFDSDAIVDGYQYNDTDDLANMKHLTKNRKRILDIRFPDDSVRELNLNDLLDNCTSLQGINIRSLGSCFEINRVSGEQFTKKKSQKKEHLARSKAWTSNIEDAVLDFNRNDGKGDSACEDLLSTLQNKNCNLRFLEVFCCSSSDEYCFDEKREEIFEWGRKDKINMPSYGLERFILLEKLKLTSSGSDIHTLEPVLRSLSNLKKLHLTLGVGSENQTPWDSTFPFECCRNLQELKITINPDMKALPWGNDFIKNYQCLQNLDVLEIYDEAKPMPLKTFCPLVRKLLDLDNLRKLVLKTHVISPAAYQDIPEEIEEVVKSSFDGALERLKAQVKNFIIPNRKLEELYIGKLEGFKFEFIKY